MSLLALFSSPLPPQFLQADRFGDCTACAPGMILSRKECILAAETHHMDFDGEPDDMAALLYRESTSHNHQQQYVTDGPWGWRAIRFSGGNDYMNLQRQYFGSAFSACFFVRYNAFKWMSNVFNFFNGVRSRTTRSTALELGIQSSSALVFLPFSPYRSPCRLRATTLCFRTSVLPRILALPFLEALGRVVKSTLQAD